MPRGQAPGYTDKQARAVHSPLSFPPAAFVPENQDASWGISCNYLNVGSPAQDRTFFAPVLIPQGVTVTKLTLFGYRSNALGVMELTLERGTRTGVLVSMAIVTADWITGDSSGYDDSIDNPIIDNESYNYALKMLLSPSNAVDTQFAGALIEFAG